MATLTMEQDPDLKRFIEDRKQRYYDNDKAAVFATSLPLSNNGVEDRRSQLRDERHRDYQRYLERPPANSKQSSANSKQSSTKQAVYYRMDSPERGLPLGNYDLVKEKLSQERHQDYRNYLKKKHQDESERNRTRYSPSRPQAPPQPRIGDIDYSQMKQELADERKRDYQDYLQQQEHMYVRAQQENGIPVLDRTPREDNSYVTSKPPPGPGAYRQRDERESERYRPHADELPPPGPSDFPKSHHYSSDEYEKYRKDLQQKQQAEYQDFLQKKNQQAPDRTWKDSGDNTQGLILGDSKHENQKKLLNDERRREYNEHLAQQKELPQPKRTWPEPEGRGALLLKQGEYENLRTRYMEQRRKEFLSSLERNIQPRPRSYPGRLEKAQTEIYSPFFHSFGQYEDTRQKLRADRRRDFLVFLEELRAKQAARREGFTPRDAVEETPVVNALGHYEDFEQKLREERKMETEKFILEQAKQFHFHREKSLPQLASAETPIISHMGSYDSQKLHLKEERHKDLVAHIEKQNRSYHSPYENFMYPTVAHAERPLVENLGSNYEVERRKLAEERKRDFELYLEKKQMSDPPRFGRNTPPVVGPYSGIFAGLGQYDLDKQRLKKERQTEYSTYLDKTYAEKGRPYGRPTWAKDIDDSEQYPARPYSYEHRSNPDTKPRDHLPPIEGQGQGDRRPPSYEDMLAKKRQMEADRRRYDPGFAPRDGEYAPRDGGYGGDGNQM